MKGLARMDPVQRLVRGLIVGAVLVLGLLALASGYRAWVQVFDLTLGVSSPNLKPGVTVHASVVTSGRTWVDVKLEVQQGANTRVLATKRVPKNGDAALDPRPRRARLAVQLLASDLEGFRNDEPVMLRVTAVGGPQWTRTPPPTIQEMATRLDEES